jgi:hypothetical protein
MEKWFSIVFLTFMIFFTSCNKIKDYFREPDSAQLIETINSASLTAYASGVVMAEMNGYPLQYAITTRSNEGFPCTSITHINLAECGMPDIANRASSITVAGLWPDANTAIFSMIFTDYNTESGTLNILSIQTIPVMLEGNDLQVVMAGQDISLNPDKRNLLSINLSTFEIESELFRLAVLPPEDVYVAILQRAYFIKVNTNSSLGDPDDDIYTITGGGQLVKVSGNQAEITQQAMVDVCISPECMLNPIDGMALIKITGIENEGFPELGTAILEFTGRCKGSAVVFAATGMFAGSNGQRVSFLL